MTLASTAKARDIGVVARSIGYNTNNEDQKPHSISLKNGEIEWGTLGFFDTRLFRTTTRAIYVLVIFLGRRRLVC